MYKVDTNEKTLIPMSPRSLGELGIRERFDLQEWIEKTPSVLDDDLLVIGKELVLPSGIRLDLLAVDRQANLVVIELKRDSSGRDVEWQSIKYASYCSNFLADELFEHYATYLGEDADDARDSIESFIETELNELNNNQRIILVAQNFHSDVVSAVLWLRDYGLEIKCVRLRPFVDQHDTLFIVPDVIIPLPEARDYIQRKEAKQQQAKRPSRSTFSLEKGTFDNEELKKRWRKSLTRPSDLTPRFIKFVEIILSEERPYDREEIKAGLYEGGIGVNIGQTGRYLSGVSQFLTKKSSPHLRQVITFDSGGEGGEVKNNYFVVSEYRPMLIQLLADLETSEAD
ncbi:hypothetical protein MNBD_CHLOROFLEXI01-3305 [hydrothermal vent metagenome]|uniref:Uncharacterized protein n=1 Tax=hydrothermal vent metagenome TaxID=652676 RepID=A0A3B0W428_9ZZZZ